jgi:hypothetical protein
MKKILFFNPYSCWSFHLETDLEIINCHIEQGDKVTVLTCDGDLLSCEPNPNHKLSNCQSCIHRRHQGFKFLEISNKVQFLNLVNLSKNDRQVIANFPKSCKNLHELKSLFLNNFDLGLSVASSLIDYTREPYPNPNNYQEFIQNNIESALVVYLSIQNHIRKQKPDKMYIFNGRFAPLRAAMRAAQLLSINFDVHERAGVQGKYSLTSNTYPHDLTTKKAEIELLWNSSRLPQSEKINIGSQWFIDRRLGNDQGWYSFTASQNEPPNFLDKDKVNIVIFNSSQDEFEAISGWKTSIYSSQTQGIFKLAQSLQSDEIINLYLRVHPNLAKVTNSQTKAIDKLKGRYSNFHVIDAEDSIKSYDLMDAADCVITFGSTMGVESAFHKKSSILLGNSLYEDLGICCTVSSHDELVELIVKQNFNLPIQMLEDRKSNAIKYGFYMAVNGIDFRIFKQQGIFELTFKDDKSLNDLSKLDSIYTKLIYRYRKIMLLLKAKKHKKLWFS